MKAPTLALSFLLLSSTLCLPLAAMAGNSCELRAITAPAKFPIRSQLRGQRGIVLLEVAVDSHGRAIQTRLIQSSGHRLLDRAATASVRDAWIFDISGCERQDLPATRTVAVEYRNEEFGR